MDENIKNSASQMEYRSASGETPAKGPRPDTVKIVAEMQKREAMASAVYKFLARRVTGRGGEMLMRVAGEKSVNAETLSRWTDKKGKAPLLKVWGWRLLSRLFGSSFVISRLEAGEAEARPYFAATADEIPEAASVSESGEKHRIQLREVINLEGLRGIGSIVTGLYSAVLLITGSLAGFITALNDKRAVAVAGFCTGVAAALAAAVTGYSSQKAATGRQRPAGAAFSAFVLGVIASVLLVAPFFYGGGAWGSMMASLLAAAAVLALLAFFASVVRQETYFIVFVEMVLMTIGVSLAAMLAVWVAKAWFGLNG